MFACHRPSIPFKVATRHTSSVDLCCTAAMVCDTGHGRCRSPRMIRHLGSFGYFWAGCSLPQATSLSPNTGIQGSEDGAGSRLAKKASASLGFPRRSSLLSNRNTKEHNGSQRITTERNRSRRNTTDHNGSQRNTESREENEAWQAHWLGPGMCAVFSLSRVAKKVSCPKVHEGRAM